MELYRPALVPNLAPVVSPMLAHAEHLKKRLGKDIKVVFIGPCVAKKAEAERPEHDGLVDVVLTFDELAEWLQREGIDLSACEESSFDEEPRGDARLFPLEGGCVRTAGWTTDLLAGDVVVASGYEEVGTALDGLGELGAPRVVEPLFCPQGCINGPALAGARNVFVRRGDVLQYAAKRPHAAAEPGLFPQLTTRFQAGAAVEQEISEDQIRHMLERTGKAREEDQLNCGACGYGSCRDKAIAVIRGLAEPEMCIPHMRRLAEQRVDRIIETSPNGIVILDEQLRILHTNPAFRRYFTCSPAIHGQPVSALMDPEPFERLASGQDSLIEMTVEHTHYSLICHQIAYLLPKERQYVGIFVNITNQRTSQQKLDTLRTQTITQASELLQHQIQMAEEIARFLGESTARGEDLVEKLILLGREDSETARRGNGQWLRDIYTSK